MINDDQITLYQQGRIVPLPGVCVEMAREIKRLREMEAVLIAADVELNRRFVEDENRLNRTANVLRFRAFRAAVALLRTPPAKGEQ